MTLTYTKAPRSLVRALLPSEHVYRVEDPAGRLIAVVAGSGRSWTAGRVMPSRVHPFGRPEQMGRGASRDAAVADMP